MIKEGDIKKFNIQYSSIFNSSLTSFCDQFQNIKLKKDSHEQFLLANVLKIAKLFFRQIEKVKPEIEKYFVEESPNFNIFKIIGLDRKEVITHTPFLANLLSPFDSHQQSNLFLKSFLKQVLNFSNNDIENPSWNVRKEYEQIDLRITNNFLKKAVFIENKIDTVAHSGQLSRYFKKWKENYSGGAFMYLTINGDDPPDEGFDELVYSRKEVLSELKVISYKRDIHEWLESCIEEVRSKKVQYTIFQYLELIKQL